MQEVTRVVAPAAEMRLSSEVVQLKMTRMKTTSMMTMVTTTTAESFFHLQNLLKLDLLGHPRQTVRTRALIGN